jgi:hypothetical protein
MRAQAIAVVVAIVSSASIAARPQSPVQNAPERPCLHFDPAVEELVGTMVRKTVPGPPNYQSIAKGDHTVAQIAG